MEEEATHRAIMLANLTGAPLYVVHVSAKQAVEQLAAARDSGQNVFGETCPQYLYLSLEEQLGALERRVGGVRGRQVGVLDAAALARGGPPGPHVAERCAPTTLQMVSTDHCPFCMKGQKELGVGDFSQDPQRHRLGRAPHGPDVPGRRDRRDHPRALGRDHLDHAGADVRPLRQEGRHRTRAPMPTSWSTTRTATPRSGSTRPTT